MEVARREAEADRTATADVPLLMAALRSAVGASERRPFRFGRSIAHFAEPPANGERYGESEKEADRWRNEQQTCVEQRTCKSAPILVPVPLNGMRDNIALCGEEPTERTDYASEEREAERDERPPGRPQNATHHVNVCGGQDNWHAVDEEVADHEPLLPRL
jgi:hypothetical protein